MPSMTSAVLATGGQVKGLQNPFTKEGWIRILFTLCFFGMFYVANICKQKYYEMKVILEYNWAEFWYVTACLCIMMGAFCIIGVILTRKKEPLDPEPIHGWFGLTYSSYLVLPRTLLQDMSPEWQRKFLNLVKQMENRFADEHQGQDYMVKLRGPKGTFLTDPLANYRRPIKLKYKNENITN